MTHTPYIVFREQGQWAIKSNGMHYGPFPTQRDAIRAAIDAAYEAGEKGLNGQVLLEGRVRPSGLTEKTRIRRRAQTTYAENPRMDVLEGRVLR